MKLIVISPDRKLERETDIISEMFENGMDLLHLRKSSFGYKNMETYLLNIPKQYHNRIVLHSHHGLALKYDLKGVHFKSRHRKEKLKTYLKILYYRALDPDISITASFHSLDGLLEDKNKYNYVFLSPVFDSISKKGHLSKFRGINFQNVLEPLHHRVVALGGIDVEKIRLVNEMKFSGAAVNGALWLSGNPLEEFVKIKTAMQCL